MNNWRDPLGGDVIEQNDYSTNVSIIDFGGNEDWSDFSELILRVDDIMLEAQPGVIGVQFYIDGALKTGASDYKSELILQAFLALLVPSISTAAHIPLVVGANGIGNASGEGAVIRGSIKNPGSTTAKKHGDFSCRYINNALTPLYSRVDVHGAYDTDNGAITGVRLMLAAGTNFTNYKAKLVGIL